MHTNRTGHLNTSKDTAHWTTDLRRAKRRDQIQTLLDRAAAAQLPAPDLELLRAVYTDGRTALHVAALTGDHIRTVRRRIRALTARLDEPIFLYVLRHRDSWPTSRSRVATAVVLHGLTLRQAADHLHLSLHAIRRHHDTIVGMYDSITNQRIAPPARLSA